MLRGKNMAVTVVQQNDGRLMEQVKKNVRFAEDCMPPITDGISKILTSLYEKT